MHPEDRTNEQSHLRDYQRSGERLLLSTHFHGHLVRLAMLIAIMFAVRGWVILPLKIVGVSMLPTCHEVDLAMVNRFAYRFKNPQRGDLVCL